MRLTVTVEDGEGRLKAVVVMKDDLPEVHVDWLDNDSTLKAFVAGFVIGAVENVARAMKKEAAKAGVTLFGQEDP